MPRKLNSDTERARVAFVIPLSVLKEARDLDINISQSARRGVMRAIEHEKLLRAHEQKIAEEEAAAAAARGKDEQ